MKNFKLRYNLFQYSRFVSVQASVLFWKPCFEVKKDHLSENKDPIPSKKPNKEKII